MDTELLQSFLAVARCRNFTLAAQKLYIEQPALSKRIARLEKLLGTALFSRTKRSVALTDAGKILEMEAPKLLRLENEIMGKVRQTGCRTLQHLRVAFLGAISREFLPNIRQFQRACPQVRLQLFTYSAKEIKENLTNENLDIAITIDTELYTVPNLAFTPLYSDGVSLVLPRDHPIAQSRNFHALKDEPFVLFAPQEAPRSYEQVLEICAGWGFSPRIAEQSASMENVIFLVEAGIGVAILPNHVRHYASDHLAFIPLPEQHSSLHIVAVYPKQNENPAIWLFLAKMKEIQGGGS